MKTLIACTALGTGLFIHTLAQADTSVSAFAISTLAASCNACHGMQGNSYGITPTLASLQPTYFVQRMQGFKTGTMPATVMQHHAKGLTDAEIEALAAYFASQPKLTPPALPTQAFQGAQ